MQIYFPLFFADKLLKNEKKAAIYCDLRIAFRRISGIFYTCEILLHKPSAPDWNQLAFPTFGNIFFHYHFPHQVTSSFLPPCFYFVRKYKQLFFTIFLPLLFSFQTTE